MVGQINFETKNIITTSDDYHIKLKGLLSYSPASVQESEIMEKFEIILSNFFLEIPLVEALEYIEPERIKELVQIIKKTYQENNIIIDKFELLTLDAAEVISPEKIDYEIDPNLETAKRKKGFLSRFRRK